MKNQRMSIEDWINQKSELIGIAQPQDFAGFGRIREYFMMMPVIYCQFSREVIIFRECEYCKEKKLDGNNCCVSCSAPVEM